MPRRELARALKGAIGDDRRAHAVVAQTLQREIGHLAGAQHHRAPRCERPEDLLSQLHGRGADRCGAPADGGVMPHASRHLQGRLEQPIERHARSGTRSFPRVPNLAVDLRFANHHGVETAGHTKDVRNAVPVATHVPEPTRKALRPILATSRSA